MAEPEVSPHAATTPPPVLKKAKKAVDPLVHSDLMDLTTTAAYLNRSRPWVYRAMREMGLPAIRMGKRWMTQKSRIDAWVASQPGVNLPTAS